MWLPGELIARPGYTNALPGSLQGALTRRGLGYNNLYLHPQQSGPIHSTVLPTSTNAAPANVVCPSPMVRNKSGKGCLCLSPNVMVGARCKPPATGPGITPLPRPTPTPVPPAPGCPVCQTCPTCPPAQDCPACEGSGACDPTYIEVPGDCPAPEASSTGKLWFAALAGGVGALTVAFLAAKLGGG